MKGKYLFLFFLYIIATAKLYAQSCPLSSLGQNPSTAFPVCGTNVFTQHQVPLCGGTSIPGPCNGVDGIFLSDINPYWYTFTCFEAGTLGFTLTPKNLGDDYDWQLFDITGHNPNDVFTVPSLFVGCNWSGSTGITGASAQATKNSVCATTPQSPNQPLFSSMPVLQKDHQYLLLVSHFAGDSQSGYDLQFSGGSASITDTTPPRLKSLALSCDAGSIGIKLNKKMKCSSLKLNGSEFIIQPGNIPVIASSGNCSSGFNMDSVSVTLQNTLPPGNYYLVIKNGDDGNTLLDNCDNSIPVNDSLAFTVQPLQPTMLDSIVPVPCSPNSVTLIFKKNIECNSIAADGSDFKVSGNTPVTVVGAKGFNCANGKSNIIIVTFSKPIQTKGDYTLQILNGVDGNTIIDECGQQTPPASIHFYTKDTVNADFSYSFVKGCDYDSFSGTNAGGNEINEWLWNFDKDGSSTQSAVHFNFYNYGQKRISLFVSNGVCTDSAFVVLNLDNELKAVFSVQDEICPEDGAMFKDTSIGNILSWHWNFGDGTSSSLQNPPVKNYAPSPTRDGKYYTVSLIVQNGLNCFDTATHTIKVLYTCYIAVPTAFTPNGDGINDFLYPLNAYKADNLEFRVFNRWGQQVFATKNWTVKWDGTVGGIAQQAGTYVWMLNYTQRDTGKKYFLKGTTVLIR